MGVRWVDGNIQVVLGRVLEQHRHLVFSRVEEIVKRALDEVQPAMTATAMSTPSDINMHKDNRIDTGHMMDSVGVAPTQKTKHGFSMQAGWVSTIEPYFLVQEFGGVAEGLRVQENRPNYQFQISPMHSLAHAFIVVREKIFEELSSVWG